MKIVKILGGLGNQMFQYAFYRQLKFLYSDVYVDINKFGSYRLHNGFELSKVFNGIIYDVPPEKELEKIYDTCNSKITRLKRKLGMPCAIVSEKNYNIDKLYTRTYFDGYWQSEKYFENVRDVVRKEFVFSEDIGSVNKSIYDLIGSVNSIGIHVRRGDYLSNKVVYEKYGCLCDIKYYNNAINRMSSLTVDPFFFVFSDDIDWAKLHLQLPENTVFIDWNIGLDSYKDLQLLSACQHTVISNSSFSWWAAWLNSNSSKIVVAPSRWKVGKDVVKNRVPSDWLTISV